MGIDRCRSELVRGAYDEVGVDEEVHCRAVGADDEMAVDKTVHCRSET